MIKLALVGKGKWGENYIRTISKIKECELPKEYIKTRDYKDLFQKKDIDGVIIATPAITHFKISSEFLTNGFNILIEKPLTASLKDALELKKIQGKVKKTVMVGHTFNYNDSFMELLNQVKRVGEIKFIESEGASFDPKRKDISALWDWGAHDVYMARKVFNKKPIAVSAWEIKRGGSKTNDECFLRVKFHSNLYAFIKLSWISVEKKRNLQVVGSKGILFFDDLGNEKVNFIDFDNHKTNFRIEHREPLRNEVMDFIECIKKNKEPKASLEEGVMTIKVLDAAERSLRQNGKEVVLN